MRKIIIVAIIVIVVGVGIVLVLNLNRPGNAIAVQAPTQVAQITTTPQPQETPTGGRPPQRTQSPPTPTATTSAPVVVRIKATGNILSVSQAMLAFQTGGRVKEIKAREGNRVKAGTVIAELDNATSLDALATAANANLEKVKAGPTADDIVIAKAAVDRAKAAVDQAQAAYDRIGGSSNPAIGATSQGLALQQAWITYQEAAARFNQATNHPTASELGTAIASAEQAKQSAAGARLIAPFDGTVLWVGVRVGESITVGSSAAAVADLSHMQVQVNVDEISAASLKVGQSALISVDAFPDSVLKGRVSKIALLGTATGNLVTVPVTVDLETTDVPIYPGLSATVEIATGL